jgi:hypothetical protein
VGEEAWVRGVDEEAWMRGGCGCGWRLGNKMREINRLRFVSFIGIRRN